MHALCAHAQIYSTRKYKTDCPVLSWNVSIQLYAVAALLRAHDAADAGVTLRYGGGGARLPPTSHNGRQLRVRSRVQPERHLPAEWQLCL